MNTQTQKIGYVVEKTGYWLRGVPYKIVWRDTFDGRIAVSLTLGSTDLGMGEAFDNAADANKHHSWLLDNIPALVDVDSDT